MKENKNLVFGLTSFSKKQDTFEKDGVLLFPDEPKAMEFMELCDRINEKGKTCHYEKFTWVKVDNYIGERVHVQKHFYVNHAEPYTLTEEDLKLSNKSSNTVDVVEAPVLAEETEQ